MKTIGIRIAVLIALASMLAGCNSSAIRTRMTTLCNQHKYEEARAIQVDPSQEIYKKELMDRLVNPAEAAYTAARIRELEAQVQAALDRHDDEAARQAIYAYGITPTSQRTVDAVVYLAKNAYLNSRVNPATLARWERFAAKFVDGSLKSGEYAKALAATRRIGRAAAYPETIDGLLETSADRAADQRVPEAAAKNVAASYTDAIYMLIAPRAGFDDPDYLVPADKWKDLVERLKKLQHLEVPTTGFEPGFEPDWRALKAVLADLRRALVEDDVSEKDADTIVATLLEGYKALVPNPRNGLTTYELNNRLRDLQSAAHARIMKAMSEERARDLQGLWTAMTKQMADAVDFPARETAFTAAISDRVEPAINRMLGEGARALRLYRVHGSITKPQATSLLLAALYMGFDDVANLAMGCGADIDGTGEKDVDGRTPYLLALQYGFKGSADRLLAKADTARRDANGAGAVHYAVRASDLVRLADLLAGGADARTPDRDGTTPLMLAARLRSPVMVAMLLPYSDIDATDAKGRAAVHFAAAAGDLRTLRALVSGGASTKKATSAGDDLLTLACAANAEDVLSCLLDELKLPVGERSVSWCVIHGKVLPLKTLVAHGGVLTDRHLAAAVKLALPDMVRYLVEQGCDVNAPAVHAVVSEKEWLHGYDAPWVALAGDDTADIASLGITDREKVIFYLYSQGFRPSTSKGR